MCQFRPDHEGFLQKESGSKQQSGFSVGKMKRSWQKRWFLLAGKELLWYMYPDESDPTAAKGILHLDGARIETKSEHHEFVLTTPERVLSLRAGDATDLKVWLAALRAAAAAPDSPNGKRMRASASATPAAPPLEPWSFSLIFLMLLMPASSAASWASLWLWPAAGLSPFGFLAPVGGFYWLWAWKNRLLGPLRTDGGVASFLPALLTGGASLVVPMSWPLAALGVASCLLPAFNFLYAVSNFLKAKVGFPPRKLGANMGKPACWAVVFYLYCWASLGFWLYAAAAGTMAAGLDDEVLAYALGGGLLLFVVFLVAFKKMMDALNAGLSPPPPAAKPASAKALH